MAARPSMAKVSLLCLETQSRDNERAGGVTVGKLLRIPTPYLGLPQCPLCYVRRALLYITVKTKYRLTVFPARVSISYVVLIPGRGWGRSL